MDTREQTRIRKHGTYVTMPTSPNERLAAIRRIVTECDYGKVDGVMVDLFTANAICVVYDQLNPVNQHKFSSLPAYRMAEIALKLAR